MKTTAVEAMTGKDTHPDLRSWLQRLAATDRLAVARPGISLIDELAAVAKRLERERAVLFPSPGSHVMPVVANLFADRTWVADFDRRCHARVADAFPERSAPTIAVD